MPLCLWISFFMRMTQAASVAGRCRIPDSGRTVCADVFEYGLFDKPFEGLVTARGTAS